MNENTMKSFIVVLYKTVNTCVCYFVTAVAKQKRR